jgi:long-chain acyl-CoA synthetase
VRVRPEDPVTLVYTSGTVGPPKSVILTHHNVLYEWAALDRLLHLPDGGPSVSYLPLAHIAERGLTIYGPLWKHGQVYFCPEPTDVLAQVQHARPLAFFGVPRVWEKVWSGLIAKLDAEPPRRRRLADAALAAGRRRLAAHRRRRHPGRGRVHAHHRPQEGADHHRTPAPPDCY